MAPVIAIPYWARVLRMPPAGVNTERLVELVTTPRGTRGAGDTWSYPDFVTLRDADTGIAMIGWKGGEAKIATRDSSRRARRSRGDDVRLGKLLQDDRRGAGAWPRIRRRRRMTR